MRVKVNCPIAGCGILVQVQNLTNHLEKVHELDGEIVLRLHPSSPYLHATEADLEAKVWVEAKAEAELEPEPETAPETEPETEPEKEPEPGEE